MIAWTPFLEPMNAMQSWWYLLLVPLVFGIAVIYRALREKSFARYWQSVCIMTLQVVLGILGIAVALGVFVQFVIPIISQP
ncbi:MAG: hypothetical protein H8E86_04905 [Planctomycetes bacterium]|nr:hypothetical protein [Planctomycetota bacterium]